MTSIFDARSGREFAEAAKSQGADVRENGSYNEIETEKGKTYIQDCDRPMGPQDRHFSIGLLLAIGLTVISCILISIPLYISAYGGA